MELDSGIDLRRGEIPRIAADAPQVLDRVRETENPFRENNHPQAQRVARIGVGPGQRGALEAHVPGERAGGAAQGKPMEPLASDSPPEIRNHWSMSASAGS